MIFDKIFSKKFGVYRMNSYICL